MKTKSCFKKIAFVLAVLFLFSPFSTDARPKGTGHTGIKIDRYKTMIAQKLTEKLRVDLSDQTVSVKLRDIKNSQIAENQINFNGDALAVVKDDQTQLPFHFEAQVNPANEDVEDVSYRFVEDVSEFANAFAEDYLMKELMAKIGRDYKTTNIVLSIDGFETVKLPTQQTKYQGIGEVRIGDFEWSKIKFDVVLDSQDRTATKILYEIQK